MLNFYQKYIFIVILFFAAFFGVLSFFLHNHTIDFSSLQQDTQAKPSILLDHTGKIWGVFQQDKRKYVLLESVPQHLIQAFLVTEDRAFFAHPGISFRGILRSILMNCYSRKKIQGASTITQQLVRLLFFDTKKTFSRKIKEQLYAILLERQWSKEQILEAYFNNVYFGDGVYGVQAAAHRFWKIDISEISVDQAAVLASIMKSPFKYSPIRRPENVIKRRNVILGMMRDYNMIDECEYKLCVSKSLNIQEVQINSVAAHLKETIRIFLEDLVGKHALYTQGLIIQTTLDMDIQQAAQQSFQEHVAKLRLKYHEKVDGALLSMDPETGAIRCMVGGYDFKTSKYNRALHAYRQMGSIFKVFVYAAALEQGLKLSDVEIDEPFELVSNGTLWAPKNYNNKFIGPMTRAYALSRSNNIVTIKTLLDVGVEKVIDLARRCQISASMKPYPSLALGCVDVTLLEALGSFNVIVNHGVYVKPHFISWVKNDLGQKIYKTKMIKMQVLDSSIASQIAQVLTFSLERLKSFLNITWLDFQVLGKTGTTNDSRNCWFCGATSELTTAIYIGCDQNQSMGQNLFSSKAACPIWFGLHEKIAKPNTKFYYDPKLQKRLINLRTGLQAYDERDLDVATLLE